MTDSQNTRDQITSDRKFKRAWSNCVLCIPFILGGSPNECWLHTWDWWDARVITTWVELFKAGLSWPRVSARFEFRFDSVKSISVLILFVYKLIIGRSKNNRENYPRKCFWTQEKETGVNFNPGLSANRPSNNWDLEIRIAGSSCRPQWSFLSRSVSFCLAIFVDLLWLHLFRSSKISKQENSDYLQWSCSSLPWTSGCSHGGRPTGKLWFMFWLLFRSSWYSKLCLI